MGVSVSAAMASTTQDSIVKACEWRWHEMAPALPKMADDEPATLMKLAVAGLRKRLSNKDLATHHQLPSTAFMSIASSMKWRRSLAGILRLFSDGSRSDES